MYSNIRNLPKGEEFKLFFGVKNNSNQKAMLYNQDTSTVMISKDGASPVVSTNDVVYIGNESDALVDMRYIVFTADEIDADVIIANISQSDPNAISQVVVLYTGSVVASTTQSPEVMTSICEAINEGYSVASIATGESGYNYYGLTNPGSIWWIIIRESTDFTSVGYKMKNKNAQSYADGWIARATQIYGDTFPLK